MVPTEANLKKLNIEASRGKRAFKRGQGLFWTLPSLSKCTLEEMTIVRADLKKGIP